MFCTGIENSAPTLDGGRIRVDEMESCGHYKYWREDFALVKEMGIQFLRYGPPLHTTFLGDGRYDWSFADETFAELKRLNIVPIVDLCHFGLPDWLGNFQNPDFPDRFPAYARAFAERFPWVQLYTPVNEMFICATFSARYGWWNEQLKSERGFVTAIKHLVHANVQAMRAILAVRPDALFIQSESSEYFHAENPSAIGPAEHLNSLRFLSLDLNYGLRVNSDTYEYLLDKGIASTKHQLERWYAAGVTSDEIESRKSNLIGSFKVNLATTGGMADALLATVNRGYDVRWLDEFPMKINAISDEQVNGVIKKYLKPDDMVLIKAGTLPTGKQQ